MVLGAGGGVLAALAAGHGVEVGLPMGSRARVGGRGGIEAVQGVQRAQEWGNGAWADSGECMCR